VFREAALISCVSDIGESKRIIMKGSIPRTLFFLIVLLHVAPVMSGHPAQSEMVHPSRILPSESAVPQIKLELFSDAMDGFNLTIVLRGYEMGPPNLVGSAGSSTVSGHAHLYINDVKVQRVYGRYVHLPRRFFVDGVNKLSVSLNDHDHQTWQLKSGEDVMAILLIDPRKTKFIKSHYSTSKIL